MGKFGRYDGLLILEVRRLKLRCDKKVSELLNVHMVVQRGGGGSRREVASCHIQMVIRWRMVQSNASSHRIALDATRSCPRLCRRSLRASMRSFGTPVGQCSCLRERLGV